MSNAALYVRVSTDRQDLEGQERELRVEAERRGWVVAEVYREKVSGTGKAPRAEYDRLLRDAGVPGRGWSRLLVWCLDRFSRAERFTDATAAILDLERLGVRFYSLKEPTLDTPADGAPNLGRDVLLALLPVVAAFEARRRSERTAVAMRELKEGRRKTKSGRPVGRPRRVTVELVGRAEVLRRGGLSWADVARRVGLPSETCRRVVYAAKKARGGV